ncbi:MAG: bifunctional tRNA (5-methylaminomethyl-2-thiouridine)(34)-methyltransferase MnmD/FAD-dependent 5-carboxymethylaminomethyl-2-thiouridine(34) oxidoreductase MnmC [Burkholderiales bacterium]|nr:bifunctional tRNA (5-methylaminomethyl-2-thiouridine)(34)-methyltransferase MnmD/FAD-dependent 5-carboxymethylaminomethyl-2-thiouridine(34) oxidoreductase MnmC [Burkholderiales bacterium]
MKTTPVVPGRVERDADGLPRSPDFGDVYHPRQGALAQARHVFLGGNELPARWQGRERFVVLETGFGLGNNFLAAWQAWRDDPGRCAQLHFISIEARPLQREDLAALARDEALAPLARQLAAAWPPLTCNLHRLSFEAGRVQLLLALGDVKDWLPQITASVDAFFLDGFAPARNPAMWEARLYKAMARIAAPGATAATWSVARAVREGLGAAGFEVRSVPGSGGKREITVARFAPRFAPRANPRRRAVSDAATATAHLPVAIVGGGLAGCAAAWALAGQGRASVLFERRSQIALEGSGNAAGLFHGVVHGHDGHHARFHRAAALVAQRTVALALAGTGVRGRASGLLRLVARGADVAPMQALLQRLGLPADYVSALSMEEAGAIAGIAVAAPAWHFPGGGWVEPRGLARFFVDSAGRQMALQCGREIAAIRRADDRWHLLDAAGTVLAEAEAVVLANAGAALELLGGRALTLQRSRGQLSGLASARWPAAAALRVPVAGSGYLLPPLDGVSWFGASSQESDDDPELRAADHVANIERLAGLVESPPQIGAAAGELSGRVGFRWASVDRLPLVGAVPLAAIGAGLGLDSTAEASPRPDQPRFAPRAPGLFVFAGLGSRGIAGSALGAQVLASCITGAPMPLEADLLDAVDPARFASRVFRRSGVPPGAAS